MSSILFAYHLTTKKDHPSDSIESTIDSLKAKRPTRLSFLDGYLRSSDLKILKEMLLKSDFLSSLLEAPNTDSPNDSFCCQSTGSTDSSTKLDNLVQIKPPCLFDIAKVKEIFETDFSTWRLDHDEKHRKIYVNMTKANSMLCIRSEMVVPDGDIDILSQMHINLDIRREWDTTFRNIKVAHIFSEKEDIIQHELKLMFPLSNRDFVHCRYYLSSEIHAEELEKMGITIKAPRWRVILQHSVELDECPPLKGVQRAENITAMIFEEDREDPKLIHVKTTSKTDLKGNIPSALLQKCIGNQTLKHFEAYLTAFNKNRDEWSKLTQKN